MVLIMDIVFCDVRTDVSYIFLVNIDLNGLIRQYVSWCIINSVFMKFSHTLAPLGLQNVHILRTNLSRRAIIT
jgi:hypothetical protein